MKANTPLEGQPVNALDQFASSVAETLTSLFEPHVCIACGQSAGDSLLRSIRLIDLGRISREVARPSEESFALNHLREHLCRSCLVRLPFHFPAATRTLPRTGLTVIPIFRYTDPIDRLIIGLKFSAHKAYARFFAAAMTLRLRRILPSQQKYWLVPLPLGRKRLRVRGYNQTALIARRLVAFNPVNISLAEDWLIRVRETGRQSEMTDRAARFRNVENAFQLNEASDGLRHFNRQKDQIILLDDVLSTGATLEAAMQPLTKLSLRVLALTCAGELPSTFGKADCNQIQAKIEDCSGRI